MERLYHGALEENKVKCGSHAARQQVAPVLSSLWAVALHSSRSTSISGLWGGEGAGKSLPVPSWHQQLYGEVS